MCVEEPLAALAGLAGFPAVAADPADATGTAWLTGPDAIGATTVLSDELVAKHARAPLVLADDSAPSDLGRLAQITLRVGVWLDRHLEGGDRHQTDGGREHIALAARRVRECCVIVCSRITYPSGVNGARS